MSDHGCDKLVQPFQNAAEWYVCCGCDVVSRSWLDAAFCEHQSTTLLCFAVLYRQHYTAARLLPWQACSRRSITHRLVPLSSFIVTPFFVISTVFCAISILIHSNTTSGFYPPKFQVDIGRKFPPTFGFKPPLPFVSVPSLPPFHGSIRPFFFPFFSTPLPYALSPFSPRSLLPFSFLSLPLLEGSHTQLEGLAGKVL